jgi:hypothetical protein
VRMLAFMDELGKNVSLELHSLIYYERHTGELTVIVVKVKSYTSCLQ